MRARPLGGVKRIGPRLAEMQGGRTERLAKTGELRGFPCSLHARPTVGGMKEARPARRVGDAGRREARGPDPGRKEARGAVSAG